VRVYAYVCVCVCVRSQYVLTLIWSAFALRPIANGIRQRPSSTSSISSSAYRHYHDLHFHFQSPFPSPLQSTSSFLKTESASHIYPIRHKSLKLQLGQQTDTSKGQECEQEMMQPTMGIQGFRRLRGVVMQGGVRNLQSWPF